MNIRQYRLVLPAALAAAVGFGAVARAESVSIEASRDTTIFSESGNLGNGAGSWIFAGETNDGFIRRALLAFDIASAVPAGSTITSATLTLFCSRTRTGNVPVAVHRIVADWGEGASNADDQEGSGAPAAAGDATWTKRFYPSTSWAAAGADYAVPASATAVVGNQNNFYSWTSAQLRADVQLWLVQPASNFGWLIVGDESEQKVTKRFDSRQVATSATRPVLTVTFDTAAPAGACCDDDGSCSITLSPGSSCDGSWQGIATTCEPNLCPQPDGACCLPVAAATCIDVSAATCAAQAGDFRGDQTCDDAQCPVVLEPFVDALPRPSVATPTSGMAGGAAIYDLAIREVSQKLHRDLPATRVWGFGDGANGATFPGPTIEATSGVPVTVHWINDLRTSGGALRSTHFLPVDHCPHGAENSTPRTVIHLHGGHVPAAVDGYPESTFLPGEQAAYEYPNNQLPATLWYHDHALGITRLNVYMGMAGFYLLRDGAEQALSLPAGEYEIAMAVQDRTLRADGSLVYPPDWQEHFFGEQVLVNGKVRPYLEVKRGKYRMRVLNGSTSRTYTLALSNGAPLRQIGSDGGLLAAAVSVTSVTLGPGERADLVADFSSYPAGTELFLTNTAPAPYPTGAPPTPELATVMKFVVLGSLGHTAPLPPALRPVEVLDAGTAVAERDLELRKGADACSGTAWLINGLRWHDVTEYPELGTVEIWRFINRSGVMHPMHMHLVMFQVLDRQAFTVSGETIVPVGSPIVRPATEAGWKDTVQVGPNQIVRVVARFEDYKGRYPYHCHILEHEDHEMMRQFETVSCGDGQIDAGEQCDLASTNGMPGSCCSNDCEAASAATVCRASTGECDIAEQCSGSGSPCPIDAKKPVGTPCSDDGNICTDDVCATGAVCTHAFDASNDPGCAPVTTTLPPTTTTTEPTTTTLSPATTTTTPTTSTMDTTTTSLPPAATCGDVNDDDEITSGDALLALRTAVGLRTCAICVCDVNGSGAIQSSDALAILRVAVGLNVKLRCMPC
jgi:FtsP/CotA-like multicopper oxidase with cupredoxin domain